MPAHLAVLATFFLAPASMASTAPGPTIFACQLSGGKIVTVTGSDAGFVYRYGTARKPELTITGTLAGKNLSKRLEVHGGDIDAQLRFVSGEYSYIVHSFPRNKIVDNQPVSGLKVFRSNKKISDRACKPWAKISFADYEDLDAVPDIPEGAPSAWE